jgi:hypothetical protein
MRRLARCALPGRGALLQAKDALDLAELRVRVLEFGSSPHQHVDTDAIADRHLVYEPAEIPLKLSDARVELVASTVQIDELGIRAGRWKRASVGGRSALSDISGWCDAECSAGGLASAPDQRGCAHGPK